MRHQQPPQHPGCVPQCWQVQCSNLGPPIEGNSFFLPDMGLTELADTLLTDNWLSDQCYNKVLVCSATPAALWFVLVAESTALSCAGDDHLAMPPFSRVVSSLLGGQFDIGVHTGAWLWQNLNGLTSCSISAAPACLLSAMMSSSGICKGKLRALMLHEMSAPQRRPAVDLLLGITTIAWRHKAAALFLASQFALSSDMFCLGLSGVLWLYAAAFRMSLAAEC